MNAPFYKKCNVPGRPLCEPFETGEYDDEPVTIPLRYCCSTGTFHQDAATSSCITNLLTIVLISVIACCRSTIENTRTVNGEAMNELNAEDREDLEEMRDLQQGILDEISLHAMCAQSRQDAVEEREQRARDSVRQRRATSPPRPASRRGWR